MNAFIQWLEVDLKLVVVQDIVCQGDDQPSLLLVSILRIHSVFSYVMVSTALPTRLDFNIGSLSRRLRHRRVRISIASSASWPICALTFRMSSNHCFMDAVTASLICPRSEGNEDSRCWNSGVCDRDVGGILSMSSRDCNGDIFNTEMHSTDTA